jgi:hypothetical protein
MVLIGLFVLVRVLRQRSRMPADQFDAEQPDAVNDPHLS